MKNSIKIKNQKSKITFDFVAPKKFKRKAVESNGLKSRIQV